MKIRSLVAFSALVVFAILSSMRVGARVPQENTWAGIKTDDGVLFIWNAPGLSFTLDLKGKDIKPFEDPKHHFSSSLRPAFRLSQFRIALKTRK